MIIKSTDWNRTYIRTLPSEREREREFFGHVTINGRRLEREMEIHTVWRRGADYVYKHTHNISNWKMICARFTAITLFETF